MDPDEKAHIMSHLIEPPHRYLPCLQIHVLFGVLSIKTTPLLKFCSSLGFFRLRDWVG